MAGPGMELIGEEEIEEVLEVLRAGYLYRYGISLGDGVDPRFQGKVYQLERQVGRAFARALRGGGQFGNVGAAVGDGGARHRPGGRGDRTGVHFRGQHFVYRLYGGGPGAGGDRPDVQPGPGGREGPRSARARGRSWWST